MRSGPEAPQAGAAGLRTLAGPLHFRPLWCKNLPSPKNPDHILIQKVFTGFLSEKKSRTRS